MIKDLPEKPKRIVIDVLAITFIGLFSLALYGAFNSSVPEEIILPAPEYTIYENV